MPPSVADIASVHVGSPRYTLCGLDSAEARIGQDLARVAAFTQAELGAAVRSLLLVGPYARGEGSVVQRNGEFEAAQGYQLLAVFRRSPEAADASLSSLSVTWTQKLEVDVDIRGVELKRLARVPRTLFWLHACSGDLRILWGDPDVPSLLPRIRPHELPKTQAAALLVDAALGLAISNLTPSEPEGTRLRRLNNAVLACGDALLLLSDTYDVRLPRRLSALDGDAAWPGAPELRADYGRALDFRARPDLWDVPGGQVEAFRRELLDRLGQAYFELENRRVNTPKRADAYACSTTRLFANPQRGLVAELGARLRSGTAGVSRMLPRLDHPLERLARAAMALAFGSAQPASRRAAARLLGTRSVADARLRAALIHLSTRARRERTEQPFTASHYGPI